MTPPPPVDTDVSKEKKGKKGKGNIFHFPSTLVMVFRIKGPKLGKVFHFNWSQMQAVVY
jgi:hypothetical protein